MRLRDHRRPSSLEAIGGLLLLPIPLVLLGILGCGATKEPGPAVTPDAGGDETDTGIVPDTDRPDAPGETSGPDGIELQPSVSLLRWDTVPGAPQNEREQMFFGTEIGPGTDITSEIAFRADRPAIGKFLGSVFRLNDPLPITGIGETLLVTGEARGKTGHARITVVRLRLTGEKHDFVFESPYVATPSPKDNTLIYTTAAGAGVGAEVTVKLRSDPANPGGFDANKLIASVRARVEGWPKFGCDAHTIKDARTFTADSKPVPLCFEIVAAENDAIKQAAVAGFYRLYVDVSSSADGTVYDTREVIFVVPPTDPRIK